MLNLVKVKTPKRKSLTWQHQRNAGLVTAPVLRRFRVVIVKVPECKTGLSASSAKVKDFHHALAAMAKDHGRHTSNKLGEKE